MAKIPKAKSLFVSLFTPYLTVLLGLPTLTQPYYSSFSIFPLYLLLNFLLYLLLLHDPL